MEIFWNNSLQTAAFFALLMCFASLWIYRSCWIWGSFLAIALFLAYHSGVIAPVALVPIGMLLVLQWIIAHKAKGLPRFLFVMLAIVVSLGLMSHYFPGFCNWRILENCLIGRSTIPYSLWLNFDKPFIGLFVLCFSLPLINSKSGLIQAAKMAVPFTAIGITLIILLAHYMGQLAFDPKLPALFFPWFIINLFFVTIPEEAFFRGFIQEELFKWFGAKSIAAAASIFLTSLLFAIMHLFWINSFPFILLVFIASLLYGTVYQVTRSIEASIFCHFCLNVMHFLFFAYPA